MWKRYLNNVRIKHKSEEINVETVQYAFIAPATTKYVQTHCLLFRCFRFIGIIRLPNDGYLVSINGAIVDWYYRRPSAKDVFHPLKVTSFGIFLTPQKYYLNNALFQCAIGNLPNDLNVESSMISSGNVAFSPSSTFKCSDWKVNILEYFCYNVY